MLAASTGLALYPPSDYMSIIQLRETDALATIIVAALGCHLIFRRYEPRSPFVHVVLLILIPGLLSCVLRHATALAISTTFVTYLLALCVSTVGYRLSPVHPLAKYPGPALAKVTKWWSLWIAAGGKQYVHYKALHEKYGDVVRVGPNELSFCDVDAINPILGTNGMPKGPYWDGRIPASEKLRPLITQRDSKEHARRRRPWNRAFNTLAVKDYENAVEVRVTQLSDTLANQVGTVDLGLWLSYFTYDFMGDMAFGGGTELIRDGDTDGLWHLLDAAQPSANTLGQVPWLGMYWDKIPGVGRTLNKFRQFAIQRAIKRHKEGSQNKDLFHHLSDQDGVGASPPPMAEVVSDAALVVIAGSDTTATTLSNIFWFLLRNPSWYALLQKEVDTHFPPGENALNPAKHQSMPFLNAVMNESLRLYPAVPLGSQRAPAKGSGGHIVGDHFIPEGTSVFVHIYTLHRDARYFSPLPNSFLPDRWLSAEQRTAVNTALKSSSNVIHNPAAFIPFSYGPANCVGKALALMEMRMVICQLLQRFEMRFAEHWMPAKYEEELCDWFVMGKGELPIVLTHRKGR